MQFLLMLSSILPVFSVDTEHSAPPEKEEKGS